jgi:hypothetical protein
MDTIYDQCINVMEQQGYLIPRDLVSSLRQEMLTLGSIIDNSDDFDGEFGSDEEQQQYRRYKQLLHMLWNHDVAVRVLDKVVAEFTTNFMNSVQQEHGTINSTMMTNILAKAIGDTYHQLKDQ